MNQLIKKRFNRSLKTYDENAIVQKKMAETLVNILPNKKYGKILEIGCGTGFLTKNILKNFDPQVYHVNDIVEDCQHYIKKINSEIKFISGDINKTELTEKYDLIVSNAVFQWFETPNKLIENLKQHLNRDGILAFTSFGKENFYELKEILNFGLDYPNFPNIVKEETQELEFKTFSELLRHIQNTGVNAIADYRLTKGKINSIESEFIAKYGKIKLTYNPIFIII